MIVITDEHGKYYTDHIQNMMICINEDIKEAKTFDTKEQAQAVMDTQVNLFKSFKIEERTNS